ncbi:MAG TPA: PQQ-binding-like beta-propeller repeat protein [Vicinamibacterales bacterium]|nr:PQQ-binding-like beta-propeller repeat protein [Vicinamibacterales bacterium]
MRTAPSTVFAAVLAVSSLVAAHQSAATFPAASLQYGGFTATFEPGGGFTLQGSGWPTFKGTWEANAGEVTLRTTGGPEQCEQPGRYRYRVEGTRLRLEVAEDGCPPRRMILDGSHWRPQGEPEPVPERRIVRSGPDRPRPLPAATPAKGSWPSFRGPGATGIADGQNLPERWDGKTRTNVLWRTPIPGLAHSSPVVWGDRVFVTTAISSRPSATFKPGLYGDGDASDDLSPHKWMVYAIDARTGAIAWERLAHEGTPRNRRHIKSTYASASPATDGRIVVAWFGSQGVFAYDVAGRPLWQVDLGRVDMGAYDIPSFEWGPASSPIIWKDLVILQCDTQADSFLLALDAQTGRTVWKTDRDELPSWGTPTVVETAEGPVLVTNASNFIRGYDPRTGKELWRLGGSSKITAPTPFAAGGLVVVGSGRRPERPLFVVRPGARGDVTLGKDQTSNEAVVWSRVGRGPYMPTPIVYDGILYVLGNDGIFDAYELATGNEVYRQRLPHLGSGYSASPVAADGRLYVSSEDGEIVVVAAGREFRHIATNPMGDLLMATPALANGVMYVRSASGLFAIGQPGGRTPSASAPSRRGR